MIEEYDVFSEFKILLRYFDGRNICLFKFAEFNLKQRIPPYLPKASDI